MPSFAEYASRREIMSNDMSMVRYWMNVLNATFGEPRVPVTDDYIAAQFSIENWSAVWGAVQSQFELRVFVPLILVGNMPLEQEPARLVMHGDFQTALIRPTGRTFAALCVGTEFLQNASYSATVAMFAHECAHILLESKEHPFRLSEKFIDLTAMYFGFGEHFVRSQRYTTQDGAHTRKCGYLTETERVYATRHLACELT